MNEPDVICTSFPRSEWPPLSTYAPLPMGSSPNIGGRTLWAAYRASQALTTLISRATSIPDSERTIDTITFRLAVFDKVFEM